MSDEYQLRKDIDKLIRDLYKTDSNTANVVRYDDNTRFIDSDGDYLTIDTIVNGFINQEEIYNRILEMLDDLDIDSMISRPTSISLVNKSVNSSGLIKIYYGDEPSP